MTVGLAMPATISFAVQKLHYPATDCRLNNARSPRSNRSGVDPSFDVLEGSLTLLRVQTQWGYNIIVNLDEHATDH